MDPNEKEEKTSYGCGPNCPCADFLIMQRAVEEHEKLIKDHTAQLARGNTRFEVFQVELQSVKTTCIETNQIVKSLQGLPARRMDSIIDSIIRWAVPIGIALLIASKGGIAV